MNEQEVFQWLKGLPSKDLSEDKYKEAIEVLGVYNVVDCWKSRFDALLVDTRFVNYLDLSWARADEVVLIGRFNRVDLTKAVIGTLRIDRAEIVMLDKTGVRITEIFGSKEAQNKG